MGGQPIRLHAPTHLPWGSDPLNLSGLPPWYDWRSKFGLFVDSSVGGGDTVPTIVTNSAWIMVQTLDGTTVPSGGSPQENEGTVLVTFKVTITTPGQGKAGGTSDGRFGVFRAPSGSSFGPAIGALGVRDSAIGAGYINHGSTFFPVLITGAGYLMVPGTPDTSPPITANRNFARFASNGGAAPAWPFAWANPDFITGHFMYPMEGV